MIIFFYIKRALIHFRDFISRLLQGYLGQDKNFFPCLYPGNRGLFVSTLLDSLFKRIQPEPRTMQKLAALDDENVIVFAGKYKSLFEFLYFHTTLKREGMPYPDIGFDFRFYWLQPVTRVAGMIISQFDFWLHHFKLKDPYSSGFIAEKLLKGHLGFLYLVESQAFYQRFVKSRPDPLRQLIMLQGRCDKSILIVPQNIIFSAKPIRTTPGLMDIILGSNEKPGKIRRILTLLKNPDKIHLEISEPVNLREFLNRPEIRHIGLDFQAYRLRSHLIDLINRRKRSIIGPVLKTREELTEDILTRKQLQIFMKRHGEKTQESLMQVRKKAAAYIDEIAANYNMTYIYLYDKVLTWIFNNIFEGLVVDHEGLDRIKEASLRAPLILAPCHKSHLDYLLLSYLMHKNNMPCPHIAAGKNLSFWPLGPIFRGGGAFFLRRTFKGKKLYARIFAAYIEKLLMEGFNIEFFIEGGRSRTGKLLSPKLGLLSMLIRAHTERACEDLLFVPVFVGYDRVLEEDAYLHEIEGGKKNPENLNQLLHVGKFLKKKYGKVYIKFDEPISLNDYLRENQDYGDVIDDNAHKKICRSMGYKLINAINKASIVTPHGLMASAILNCPTTRFSKKDLMFRVGTFMNFLTFFKTELADTLTIDPDKALGHVIELFVERKFIELADEAEEEISETTRFILKDNKRPILDYYKNNAISFFVPAAYTAMAILRTDTFQFSARDLTDTYLFLQDLFMDEFSFDEEKTSQDHINACFKAFVAEGIMVPHPELQGAFNLTSEGFRKLSCFAGFLGPFLESYKVALLYFDTHPPDKHDAKERIKKIQALGVKMFKRQEIILKESLSKINYINACNRFMDKGISDQDQHDEIAGFMEIIENLLTVGTTPRL